jgi:hypothetical protein
VVDILSKPGSLIVTMVKEARTLILENDPRVAGGLVPPSLRSTGSVRSPKVISVAAAVVVLAYRRTGRMGIRPTRGSCLENWKIAGPDGGESLLIGSMHVGNGQLVQPSEAVLDGANRVIIESLPTDKPPGKSLAEMLDPAALVIFQRTGQINRAPWSNGLTEDQLAVMREHLQCISPGDNADTTLRFMLAARHGGYTQP